MEGEVKDGGRGMEGEGWRERYGWREGEGSMEGEGWRER